ncbi:MAG: formyl-CoA transferase [Rickettsiales bacterium]|nr:formyl-CoA transferase [Rickettsiales bacterium]
MSAATQGSAPAPLDGVVILDLTRILAGPYATQILADLGAEVWKVEHPSRGDDTRSWGPVERQGQSAYFLSVNRNKKSICVDFKKPEGVAVVKALAARAQLVLENFPPGKLDALGLGFETLRAENPALVMTSVTAFGQQGPLSQEPGYDLIVQGYGGVMALTGPVEGPPFRVGVPIVDLTTGLNAAIGSLAALRAAERDGVGQHVDISLFDSHLSWLANVAGNTLMSGQPSPRLGNAHPNVAPYEPMPASDGWVLIAAGNDAQWQRMLGLDDFASLRGQDHWATNNQRVQDRAALAAALAPIFSQRTRACWIEMLKEIRVPAGPILRPDEALAHPQTLAAGMLISMQHPVLGEIQGVGSPYHLSRTPVAGYQAAPLLGADTDELLATKLGYSAEQLAQLREAGAIR